MSPPKRATKNRHIPAEIVEEILLNLPVKSLLRFSSVSKSWNSMISEPCFVRKYDGRERIIVLKPYYQPSQPYYPNLDHISSFPVTTIFSDNPTIEEHTTDLDFAFFPFCRHIVAFCDKLWCVENREDRSLYLLNPSMRTYRKLPHPNFPVLPPRTSTDDDQSLLYGLCYDNVGDDYKLLKIHCYWGMDKIHESEVYSLRSDSWRKIIKPLHRMMSFEGFMIRTFVNGTLHWLNRRQCHSPSHSYAVIRSLNLSTEEYGEMELPEYSPAVELISDRLYLVASSGKLCLCVCYGSTRKFVLWVMEEYGVVESWTKKFDIGCDRIPDLGRFFTWIPLSLYKDGRILFFAFMDIKQNGVLFMYKDDNTTLLRKNFGRSEIWDVLHYVDSLVSPIHIPESTV